MNKNNIIAAAVAVKNMIDSSSESSDDEILMLIHERQKHCKINEYVNNTALKYTPEVFRSHFRLTKVAVEALCNELNFKSNIYGGRHPIRPLHAVLLTLWTLANQESFRSIADRFGLQKGNAHEIFLSTCKLICQLKQKYIIWPVGENLRKTVQEFNELRGNHSFPNVVGCVDGTHIAINGPGDDNSFYNRKGFHSAILQVICNSKLEFLDIFFGWPGSAHDARVWQNSPIYQKLKNDNLVPEEYHLLGDSAYPLDTFVIVPFRDNGHLTRRQKRFNQNLSSTRVVVEQGIGRVKQVFRRLKYLNANLKNLKWYVVTACILHNFCIKNNIEVDQENDDTNNQEVEVGNGNDQEVGPNDERTGKLKRERLLLDLF